MRCRFSLALLGCMLGSLVAGDISLAQTVLGQPQNDDDDVNLLSLVLIDVDLARATTTMNVYDRNADGKLDPEEMRELAWSEEPKRFDLDRGNALTHLEVALYLASRRFVAGIEERDEVFSARQMSRYDRNKDLVVDESEIRLGHWPDDPEGFDQDDDGRLTQYEVTAGLAADRRARTEAGVTGIDNGQALWSLGRYDVDRDRRFSREEFTASFAHMSEFDWGKTDTNHDGLVTSTELAFAMAARRHERDIALVDQRSALSHMTRVDRNRDRLLEEEEIQRAEWPEYPDRFDLDENKQLTRFELEIGLADERRKLGHTQEDLFNAEELISRYDRNGNLEIEEFEVDSRPSGGEGIAITTDVYLDYDLNFDLKLSSRELASLFAKQRKEKEK